MTTAADAGLDCAARGWIDSWADDEFEARIYASLFRVLETAPIEKRLQIFCLVVRFAAEQLAIRRQQIIDDLWTIADDIGLVELQGIPVVQDALAIGFGGN